MDVMNLVAKLTLDSTEYEEEASGLSDKVSKGLSTAGKVISAGVAVATTAVASLTKSAVEGYSEYEQLVGGVETLFGAGGLSLEEYAESVGKSVDEVKEEYDRLISSQTTVLDNASEAYKTAGLSANEYMETVTGMSASLIQSLGGDTVAAAEYADMAITDMSDNANKMGTDIESIQNAYSGFAKQNYTMLDNLKLGYGGTASEMERLITDAEGLDSSFKATRDENGKLTMSYADIVDAIHIVQSDMGITGTTAKEASTTIQGSVSSMKAAWSNLVTGFADSNADIEELMSNLIETIIGTDGEGGVINNILPAVESALNGITEAVTTAAPKIITIALDVITTNLPQMISAGAQLLLSVVDGLVDNLPSLVDAALEVVLTIADGIVDALPELVPSIINVILKIVEKLTDPEMLSKLIQAAFQIIGAIAKGLINAIPNVVSAIPTIISNLVSAFLDYLPQMVETGAEMIGEFVNGISGSVGDVVSSIFDICDSIKESFVNAIEAAKNWGKDLVDNFTNGIKEKWNNLKDTLSQTAEAVKSFLGFSEPEEGPLSDFHTYAPDMMELFAKGIRDNEKMLQNTVADAFDFGDMTAQPTGSDVETNADTRDPITIIVQSVLDGRIIGETAYKYQRNIERAFG